MYIHELDELISKFEKTSSVLKVMVEKIATLEAEAKKACKKLELLKQLSEVTGEKYEEAMIAQDELSQAIEQKKSLEKALTELQQKINEGLSTLRVPIEVSKMEKSGYNFVAPYKSGSHGITIEYLKRSFGFKDKIDIDGVVFEVNQVIIRGVSDQETALKCFIEAVKTLRLFGSQLAGKVPSEVEEVCEKLHRSKHREIWEKLAEKKAASPSILAKELNLDVGLVSDTLYNWARAKFKILPIAREGRGNYFLTTAGRLVWQRYRQKYLVQEPAVKQPKDASSRHEKLERSKNTKTTLNKWFQTVYLHNRGK